ncbi:MAG: hypothetical protein ABIA08_00285 [bacterium]
MQKQVSPKIIALTFGVLVISFLAAFYVVAWQEPSQVPPEGNVSMPLNVGPSGQAKEGGLILNTGGALIGLIVDTGQTILKSLATPFVFDSSSRPDSPETGQFYFDQNNHYFYYYNGITWMRIKAISLADDVCFDIADNTQVPGCDGTCQACQGGVCGVADVNTDPGNQCSVSSCGIVRNSASNESCQTKCSQRNNKNGLCSGSEACQIGGACSCVDVGTDAQATNNKYWDNQGATCGSVNATCATVMIVDSGPCGDIPAWVTNCKCQ